MSDNENYWHDLYCSCGVLKSLDRHMAGCSESLVGVDGGLLMQPISVNGHEPTCLAAFLVMAHDAHVDVSAEGARELLSACGLPHGGDALEWDNALARVLTFLTHPQGEARHD